jgi:peptide/nickel transport system substrate-binding protein
MFRRFFFLLLIVTLTLTACSGETTPPATSEPGVEETETAIVEPSAVVEETPSSSVPTPRPTSANERELNICLGSDPNTLYPFGGPNAAARSVFSAIYDGPIDTVGYQHVPVLFETLPSIIDGTAVIEPVDVQTGDMIIDMDGNLIALEEGIYVYPSGCTDYDCAVEFDGTSVEMNQLTATFKLLPDLKWSDGQPLTANDSVFTYELALDSAAPGTQFLIDRTESYTVVDNVTVKWIGIPGYVDSSYEVNFFMPSPRHAWGSIAPADLLTASLSVRPALGWGPYILDDWNRGVAIRLIKNPNYFRAGEGLPKFDVLNFIIVKDADQGVAALLNGSCDVIDPSVHLENQVKLINELTQGGKILSDIQTTPMIERLDFGLYHASYDDEDENNDRIYFFDDENTRKGIALCLDRQKVVDTVLGGYSVVPDTFVPNDHPYRKMSVQQYPYDVQLGSDLLTEAGWKDHDNNPATPRLSQGIEFIPDGTALILNYYTTSALQRRQASEIFAASLSRCGVQVNIQYVNPQVLFAPGPEGLLFGRKFDLAQYAVASTGAELPCSWFMSNEIPYAENEWTGMNVSGYSDGDFDSFCFTASNVLSDQPAYFQAYQDLQDTFASTLPSIPLYQRIKVGAARIDMCSFALESSALYDLAGIELFDYGACTGN